MEDEVKALIDRLSSQETSRLSDAEKLLAICGYSLSRENRPKLFYKYKTKGYPSIKLEIKHQTKNLVKKCYIKEAIRVLYLHGHLKEDC